LETTTSISPLLPLNRKIEYLDIPRGDVTSTEIINNKAGNSTSQDPVFAYLQLKYKENLPVAALKQKAHLPTSINGDNITSPLMNLWRNIGSPFIPSNNHNNFNKYSKRGVMQIQNSYLPPLSDYHFRDEVTTSLPFKVTVMNTSVDSNSTKIQVTSIIEHPSSCPKYCEFLDTAGDCILNLRCAEGK